jgi:hypothetical protein
MPAAASPGRLDLCLLAVTVSYVGYIVVITGTAAPIAMSGVRDEVRAVVEAAKAASGT